MAQPDRRINSAKLQPDVNRTDPPIVKGAAGCGKDAGD